MTDNTDPQSKAEITEFCLASVSVRSFEAKSDPILTPAQNEGVGGINWTYQVSQLIIEKLRKQIAELTHSNAALLAAAVEETARADRAERMLRDANNLIDALTVCVENPGEGLQKLLAMTAETPLVSPAVIAPDHFQDAQTSNGGFGFGQAYWKGRQM